MVFGLAVVVVIVDDVVNVEQVSIFIYKYIFIFVYIFFGESSFLLGAQEMKTPKLFDTKILQILQITRRIGESE